ncbi:hypothetical protein C8J55DRAFT_515169 [Lentinula edodes]|uniref:Uncharacterized protein n=1 Tax=Lentinula lateritia TaxID=40482 RepID=A0A9W9A9F7_9AGAR|nr:hypothetical protein C8J55DRAFT_515169 [Lentinula edodes]
MAQHRQEVAEKKIEKDTERKEKRQAARNAVDAVRPIFALTEIDYRASRAQGTTGYFSVPEITMQLKWHKQHGIKGAVPRVESSWGKRDEKVQLLRAAVEEYNSAHASQSTEEPEDLAEETIPEALDEFDSDGHDSEEEYYR